MIALLQGAPVYGGIEEHYVVPIVAGLREAGGEEVVLIYPELPALAPLRALAGANVALAPFPAALLSSSPRLVLHLARALRRRRPRLAHLMDIWAPGLVAAKLGGVTRVLVTHHTVELPRRDNLAGRLWWKLGWATRPEVVYISETNRRKDRRYRLTTHVMDYGINVERFGSASPALTKDGPLIGTVARLAPQKAQWTIVEAAQRILARHPGARFAIVGEGESRQDLERLARDRGVSDRFLFTGARSDIPQVLASLDVFVLPSLYEGLPHSLIEAQVAGVPTVATAAGGSAEIVVDGVTGLLIPMQDPAALADAVIRLLDQPVEARRLADEAQRRARERFSQERLVERAKELYAW